MNKEKLIQKYLGITTPEWIAKNAMKMLNEYQYQEEQSNINNGVIWTTTNELRWLQNKNTNYGKPNYPKILQQKSINNTGEEKWEDIPTINQ